MYETTPGPMSQHVIEGDATIQECADPQCRCHTSARLHHPAVEVTLVHPVTGALHEGWTATRPVPGEPYRPCIRLGEWVIQWAQYRHRDMVMRRGRVVVMGAEPANAQLTAYHVPSGHTQQSAYTARWWDLLPLADIDPSEWHR